MKIGAVNNYNKDLCDEIRLISSEGFDFIDMTLEPLFSHRLDIKSAKDALKETKLEVIGHTSAFLPVIFPLESIRESTIEEYKRYIEFFSDLGVKLMNVHPSTSGTLMTDKKMFKYNKEFLVKLYEICAEKGLTLMVESVMKPFNTPEAFEFLLEGLDDVKVHLDVGHCHINTDRDLVDEFFYIFGERIVHVHFSDNYGNRDDHLPLGCGSIDWNRMVDVLKKYGYDNTITLEVFTQDRRYLLHSKKYLEEILSQN
jgi:sugar phosphate isomerase/epimerase